MTLLIMQIYPFFCYFRPLGAVRSYLLQFSHTMWFVFVFMMNMYQLKWSYIECPVTELKI